MKIGKGSFLVCVGLILCFVFAGYSVAQTDPLCVIICPGSLSGEALNLKNSHDGNGISYEIVTTEYISENCPEADDPPFDGYKDKKNRGWRNISNYNYTLAKQIVSYLQTLPSLTYVTILGDGLLVPPSYYFYYKSGRGIYSDWVPTDFFYTSPDYDFTPDLMVGRLPVNDADEAQHVIDKIDAWSSVADWSWFKNVYFAAGGESPFGDAESDPFHAERNVIELINPDLRLAGFGLGGAPCDCVRHDTAPFLVFTGTQTERSALRQILHLS